MKIKTLLAFIMLLPGVAYCQTVTLPAVGYSESPNTQITKIEVTKSNTIITFKHILRDKGAWVQLNKSIYLQDANGEARYNYIKAEGIPLRPEKFISDKDYQELEFKVYFQKLEPGTKKINVIERARSIQDQANSTTFFNFYNVSLSESALANGERTKITDVVLMPPSPPDNTITTTGTDVSTSIDPNAMLSNFAPMMGNMYTSMLDAQLKIYSKPETVAKLARITKNYFDALVKVGFSEEAALKIIISKPLIALDGKQ